MVTYVLDSSAVLAHLWNEPGGDLAGDVLHNGKISTVNLSEVIAKLHDRGIDREAVRYVMSGLAAGSIAFDAELAVCAGDLRRLTRHKGLSLGDRACLALAIRENATALTADRGWADLDVGCRIELIR